MTPAAPMAAPMTLAEATELRATEPIACACPGGPRCCVRFYDHADQLHRAAHTLAHTLRHARGDGPGVLFAIDPAAPDGPIAIVHRRLDGTLGPVELVDPAPAPAAATPARATDD